MGHLGMDFLLGLVIGIFLGPVLFGGINYCRLTITHRLQHRHQEMKLRKVEDLPKDVPPLPQIIIDDEYDIDTNANDMN